MSINIKKHLLTIIGLVLLTSCIGGGETGTNSAAEEKVIVSGTASSSTSSDKEKEKDKGGASTPTSAPGGGRNPSSPGNSVGWSGLATICNQATSDVEELLCSLDDILSIAVQSGQGLQSVSQEISEWLVRFRATRSLVCKDSAEVTKLSVGSIKVMNARGFLPLPIPSLNSPNVPSTSAIDPIANRFVQVVLNDTLSLGCQINSASLNGVIASTGGPSNGSGAVSGGVKGGGASGPTTTSSVACVKIRSGFVSACQPSCLSSNSCDVSMCENVKNLCVQYNCNCI